MHPRTPRATRVLPPARTGILAVALIALSGPLAAPARALAADNPNNIPGVPLPGAIVTGQLGGSIYDVVYRVNVPAGHVLVASMTGSPGTDFDLYLFDSSATDIYANPPVGQVAESTGPTSSESITYPSVGSGTYYLDLSAFSPMAGTYRLAVQVAADTTAPRVTLTLDGGAPFTNNPVVTATIVATDDLSGVDSIRFSTDGVAWTAWQPYQASVPWSFTAADGPKDLWVRARDRAGNVSAAAHATITLDRVPPTVVARDPAPNGIASGLVPTFSVRFSKQIAPATWYNAGLILQAPGGQVVYGTYRYDAATATGTFTPHDPLIPGAAYVVSLGPILDLAGNKLAPVGSWTVVPLLAPSLTLASSARVLSKPGAVEMSGQIGAWAGGPLNLEEAADGITWTVVQPLIPSATGSYRVVVPVRANTYFRVHFGGTSLEAEGVSPTVRVLVRRHVELVGVDASLTRITSPGTSVRLIAQAIPAAPAATVSFRFYRLENGTYRYIGSYGRRTDASGRASLSWHLSAAGRYYVRVFSLPAPSFANGVSPIYRWVVR